MHLGRQLHRLAQQTWPATPRLSQEIDKSGIPLDLVTKLACGLAFIALFVVLSFQCHGMLRVKEITE